MDPFYELHCRLESLISVTNRQMYRAITGKNGHDAPCKKKERIQLRTHAEFLTRCK